MGPNSSRRENDSVATGPFSVTDRLAGRLLIVSLSGPVLIGAAMTASLFGAIGGVPLLVLTVRPWLTALRFARGDSRLSTAAMVHVWLACAVGTIAFAAALAYGRNDVDNVTDAVGILLGILLLACGWTGALRLPHAWQRTRRPAFET